MARVTILISVYVKKYGLWSCSFRVHVKINSLDLNKPEKVAEELSTLRDIFCPCSESFIHVYYYPTENKEQITRLSITRQDTKDEIYKNFKNKEASNEALIPLYFDNTVTIKFL